MSEGLRIKNAESKGFTELAGKRYVALECESKEHFDSYMDCRLGGKNVTGWSEKNNTCLSGGLICEDYF